MLRVAPRSRSSEVFRGDAVVRICENPLILANWTAKRPQFEPPPIMRSALPSPAWPCDWGPDCGIGNPNPVEWNKAINAAIAHTGIVDASASVRPDSSTLAAKRESTMAYS